MSDLLNCTPHDITLYDDLSNVLNVYKKSSNNIRLEEDLNVTYSMHNGVRVHSSYKYGAILDVPRDYGLIVSMLVGEQMANRGTYKDIFSPDTGRDVVRDAAGRIIGTKSFIQWA